MPPKKKEEGKAKPLLGRFKTNLKVSSKSASCAFEHSTMNIDVLGLVGIDIHSNHETSSSLSHSLSRFLFITTMQVGIVGLPNVGKSTLFNTLTKMGIPAENFPFCTIDPNNVRC